MAVIGIDLGTTNSLVSCLKQGKPQIVPNALKQHLTPSVVSMLDDGSVIIGQAAKDRLISHPTQTVGNFKRAMGTAQEFKVGKKKFRAEELSALVLRQLKEDAEAYLGEDVTDVVISVPAYFSEAQRSATLVAAKMAELPANRLINEPTAAALAYGLDKTEEDLTFLVFDLGGGTFDVSIMELIDGTMQVQATAGEAFLGGEDFTEKLVDHFLEQMESDKAKLDLSVLAQIRNEAERVKCELAKSETVVAKLKDADGQEKEVSINRDQIQEICADLIKKLHDPLRQVVNDSDLDLDEIDQVVFVGGSTRMSFLRQIIAKTFKMLPLTNLNPDEVVCLGAGVQAELKARNQDLKEVIMTDVCPHSLGVETNEFISQGKFREGVFSPVIERNTTVPVSRESGYSTMELGQTRLDFNIYQGEARLVKQNTLLGKLSIAVPANRENHESVTVRFTYDINGILEVEATNSKDVTKRVVIEERPGSMSQTEVDKRLKALSKLKVHPRDQAENQAAISAAEKLYATSLGDMRGYISNQIAQFETVVGGQDLKEIEKARNELLAFVASIDSNRF